MAAVAPAVGHEPHVLEPSENWDDDFEFGHGGRPSTSSNRKDQNTSTRTRPSNDNNNQQRRPSGTATNGRTFSMASSTMEDWDLPDTHDTPAATTGQTENWDDDFEVETRNNSPRKPMKVSSSSSPRRRDVREESWDDELEMELEGALDPEFGGGGRREEEDRTVTARSRRAALSRFAASNNNPSPPPPMPFFPPSNSHPSPEPFPRSPTASVFSVPNTIHTYSSSTPLVYGSHSHLRPALSGFALLPPSPPIHKERERRRLRKKSRPRPEGRIELVDMAAGRYSFSDDEGPTTTATMARNGRRSATPMSDVSSVLEERQSTSPPPPLPTQSVSVMPSGSTTTMPTPATPTKGGATLLSRIGSVKKWGVRRRRGTSSTPSEVVAAESSSHAHDAPDRTPRPKTSMSSFTPEPSSSSSYPSTTNGTSSIADTSQHASSSHAHWFFRSSSGTGSPGPSSSSARPGSSGRDSIGPPKQRNASTSRSRTRERGRDWGGDGDVGDTHNVGARASSSSRQRRPPPAVIGNGTGGGGDWNASRTSLRLAVGLQRESVMENSPAPSPSRPSSPLPSMQGVSAARKTRVSYSGRRPSLSGVGAGGGEKVQTPMTPSKLVKRKSLGFVRLGFGAGHPTEEKQSAKYPLGRRVGDSDGEEEEEEEYGDQQPRTRRKSFSRLLLDRDKPNPKDHDTPTKEGSRGFMGSVRRISLVGRHKRAQSGGAVVVPSSPAPSVGGFFNRGGGGNSKGPGPGAVPPPPPLPYSLPPLPTSGSQLSLRLPEASGSSYSLHQQQQPLNHPNLHLTSRRIVSASSGRSDASSVFPASTVSGGSAAGSHSRSTGMGVGVQRTPDGKGRQRSKSRTRRSEDGERREQQPLGGSSSTARRPSVGATANANRRSVDFVFESEGTRHQQQQQVLLPPIELQPPSPPRTLGQSAETMATPKAKAKVNEGKHNSRSLASALTAFDMNTLNLSPSPSSPSSLSPGAVPSSPLSVSALAPPPVTPQAASPSTSSSSLFFTPAGSPYPPASPNKLGGPSPGKQSASLGRAAAVGVVGGDGKSVGASVSASGNGVGVGGSGSGHGGNGAASASASGTGTGNGSVPRRNSLGDLKIPARISQAQVGLRRDLGMVREFAMNIEQLKELQLTYQALVRDVQGIIESNLHLQPPSQPSPALLPLPIQPTSSSSSTGFFSQLKVKTRGRSNTNPTPDEISLVQSQREQREREREQQRVSRYKELAAAFYTLNSKYRISWECAELLIELAGGGGAGAGDSGGTGAGISTTTSWGGVGGTAPPAEFLLPSPNEIMGGAGAGADLGVGMGGKKRSRERAITLAGDEAKPTPSSSSSIPAALSASSSSMPSNNANNSWRASTGRHDLSHRQLVLLREMLNNSNATADVTTTATPEDVEAEVEELVMMPSHLNREWRWGDAGNSTVTLPSSEVEEQQQRGGKRRSGRMSGIRDMLRALKRSAGATTASPPPLPATEQPPPHHHHHHHHHQEQPPVPLLSPEVFQSTASLSTESSAGSRRRRYPNIPLRIPNARRANKSSTGPESIRSASKSTTTPTTTTRARSPEAVYPASFSAPKPSPRRPSLASIFRNIGGSKRPVSVSVDDMVVRGPIPSSATTTATTASKGDDVGDSGTGDSSSNTGEEEEEGEEEDWDRMDSASDLDAAANAPLQQVVEGGSDTVRGGGGGGSRKLGKNRKGRSPYLVLQDPHVVQPKRSFCGSQASFQQQQQQQGSPTSNFGTATQAQLVRPLRLSNVDETDYPHSPVLPTTTTSRPSSRVSGKFGSPTQSNSIRAKPPNVLAASATMPILSSATTTSAPLPIPIQGPPSSTTMPVISSPASGTGIAVAAGGDWKLAMTPENIRPLLENAREVHARLCDCVEELGRLKEMVGVGLGR
ncbi:hypothetical protein M413DRAFT_325892 [Hebeloma cylindrosporum]|uniref:Uncharacterized protein n=1 Tax=Hebeloma cylindrosporum TaxID=76867 RepID=A0A0C3BUK9_HEBCY|nr:hypothetical protein M413DRAFT_325892 [Hebeloma cylindrosporum h7]